MAKATSLKDLNDQITSVRASQLDARVGETIMGKYVREMDSLYVGQSKKSLGSISIPSLQMFATIASDLRKELIGLYDRTMCKVKGYDSGLVSDDMKFAQGALLDGLCFVYDFHTDNLTLATANLSVLVDLGVGVDVSSKVWKNNSNSDNPSCVAFRIDVEYLNGEKEFTFKAVNARDYAIDEYKKDTDGTKRFCLIPYIASVRLMKLCERLLRSGNIVRVRQSTSGGTKIRFLTENKEILAKYCDDPNAVGVLNSGFFPLKSFFYAPVVGAPSTTAMVSRVGLFNIDNIRVVSEDDMVKAGVRKPENPIRALFGERHFVNKMMVLKNSDPARFESCLKAMSYQGKIFRNIEDVSAADLSAYLHSVTPAAVEKAYRVAEVTAAIDFSMRYFGSASRPMTPEELADIEQTLRNNVCKFVIRKNDCTLSSLLVTNDKSSLVAAYGNDLNTKYEGFGFRFGKFSGYLHEFRGDILDGCSTEAGSELWCNCREECEDWGLTFNDDVFNKLVEIVKNHPDDEETIKSLARAVIAEASGIDAKRSEAASQSAASNKDKGIVLCRSLTATLDERGKPVEFYKNLDVSKILSALIIESP